MKNMHTSSLNAPVEQLILSTVASIMFDKSHSLKQPVGKSSAVAREIDNIPT
jgi:hypothetical protein